jgi:hypothetical protein
MIACHRKFLVARCRQRGYTLGEVRPCIVSEDGDTITVDVDHPAYPRAPKPGFVPPPKPAPQPPALAREADPVSWLQKARNFAVATAKHIAAGMPTASDEVILERWSICQGCEFLKNDACSKCGCPVARDRKFVSKLAWADQSCPVGKWGPASA